MRLQWVMVSWILWLMVYRLMSMMLMQPVPGSAEEYMFQTFLDSDAATTDYCDVD